MLPRYSMGFFLCMPSRPQQFRAKGRRPHAQPHKLKETELASMLREFKIRPCTIWPQNRTAKSRSAKGYRRSQFAEAWRAYADGTPAHASKLMPVYSAVRLISRHCASLSESVGQLGFTIDAPIKAEYNKTDKQKRNCAEYSSGRRARPFRILF